MEFTKRESATLLHSLRVLQEMRDPSRRNLKCTYAEEHQHNTAPCGHYTDNTPLSSVEINLLCEKINQQAANTRQNDSTG